MVLFFYIYGSLQLFSSNTFHFFDAVKTTLKGIMKIVYPLIHYHILWYLVDCLFNNASFWIFFRTKLNLRIKFKFWLGYNIKQKSLTKLYDTLYESAYENKKMNHSF